MDYLIISNYVISSRKNRVFFKKRIKINKEISSLIELCKKRFKEIESYLSKKEKYYYQKSLNGLISNQKRIIKVNK